MLTTDLQTGESVRGFCVIVHTKPAQCIPPGNQPLLTGEQALDTMRQKTAETGAVCVAHTDSKHGGMETLTVEEMENLYAEEIQKTI